MEATGATQPQQGPTSRPEQAQHTTRRVPPRRKVDPTTAAALREQGFTIPEIQAMLKASKSTVRRALEEAGALKPMLPKDTRDPSAVAVLRGLLTSADESIRLRAALGLLSNAGAVRDPALIEEAAPPPDDDGQWIRIPRQPA